MNIILVNYSKLFLDLSWKWLNDAEIKKLTDTPDFTKSEQENWYNSLQYKNDYLIFGILYDNEPIGVCGLKNVSKDDCEYWGYIGEKKHWGKGIGKQILSQMEKKAIELKLKSIWLKVIKNNKRAISLYEKGGYILEKQTEILFFMRKYL